MATQRTGNYSCKKRLLLAHVRRKFHEAIGSQPSKYSHALTGEKYCNLLFKEYKKLASLDAKERQKQRTLWIKPIVEEFFSWASNLCVLPNSKIGKAIEYALNYKEGLYTFLEDGRLEPSTIVQNERLGTCNG
ncbi:MAG: IS66 family transposase [Enterococcus sp.]|uniref:IS66 family transposase n=1 Tax=Enterococcus sp. TaxID=35783 RepID=UPI00399688ED